MTGTVLATWSGPGWYAFRAYHARDGTLKVVMVRLMGPGKPRAAAETLAAAWRLSLPFKLHDAKDYAANLNHIYQYGKEYREQLIQTGAKNHDNHS